MKILIATPILFDRMNPFNHLFKDILEGFLEAGHEIVRIVAVESDADTDYTLGIRSERIFYVKIRRKRMAHANVIKRYLADTITNIRMAAQIRHVSGVDVLFEDVSYSSYWSVRAARRSGLRVISMLQDIWPDNAVQSGLIGQGSLLYRCFERLQKNVYRHSDRLICISDDMKAFTASKGVPAEKIGVIYNWGYGDARVDIPWLENRFAQKFALSPDVFYAVYAGNIGRMQNVELVIGAAALLKQRQDICFLIVGDGVRREAIERLVIERQLDNVMLLPMQPSELATSVYSAADVNIIPLLPGGVKTALPSKTGVVLSCGRPAIFCFGGTCTLAEMVNAYGAGSCVDSGSPEALAAAIAALCEKGKKRVEGVWRLFEDRFSRTANRRAYAEYLKP